MSDVYTVYKYIPNESHENRYNEMITAKQLSNINKIDADNREMRLKWIYHFIVTFGKVRLFALYYGGRLVHYSFYTPYCYKYRFMKKKDYVIGPCWTSEAFRGNRIYPTAINEIALTLTKTNVFPDVYLLIRPDNKESTNAVMHTEGWVPVGAIRKTVLKNYKKCNWDRSSYESTTN